MSEQTTDGGQDLHARIMNIPWRAPSDCMTPTERMGYDSGHRDARHAAAELAAGQEHALHLARSRILELEQALLEVLNTRPTWSIAYGYAEERARSVLNKENGNG